MRRSLLLLALAFFALPLFAQPDPQNPEGAEQTTPSSWIVRLDKAMDDVVIGSDKEIADIWFVNMTPGWHITTGPAGIFYHPASIGKETYSLQATYYLFDPGERNEAYGVFFGGQMLDGDHIQYDYFLLRNTGEFLIKRRQGEDTSVIQEWTANKSIATYGPDSDSSVKNHLMVNVMDEEVVFLVNDQEVARIPKSDLHTDGTAGLRINHALNVHVSELAVTATKTEKEK